MSIVVAADAIAPTGSILINDSAAYATRTSVTLNLPAADSGGSGLASMRFRNSTADPYSDWEPYRAGKSWTLSEGRGTKKVYVQFMDGAGNISDANPVSAGLQGYWDAIELKDGTPPTGSVKINNGAASTRTPAVTLNLSAADSGGSGLASMRFRNSPTEPYSAWEPYQPTKDWILAGVSGTQKVYVQFRDNDGNLSDANPAAGGAQGYMDSIVFNP